MIELTLAVEKLVKEDNLSYIEAVMEYMTRNRIDICDINSFKNLLNPTIIEKIEDEAYDKHMMGRGKKRPKRLPME